MKRTCLRRFSRVLLAATAFGILPAAPAQSISTAAAPPPEPRRPSIIFIQCDGLGYGDLSCYGQTKFQTPNLDQLAADGIRFTDYYAGDAASSPANAALLLGRDSAHLKQRADMDVPLAADEITVAQRLQQSGYRTGLIGEWYLGGDGTSGAPWQKGFDEFAGYLDPGETVDYYADYIWHYAPARNPTSDHPTAFQGRETLYANADGKKGEYIPDLFAKAAGEFHQGQPTRPIQPLPAVFPAVELHHRAPGRRQHDARADRRAVFGRTVAATGKKPGRHDCPARRLHRPIAGAIAKAGHESNTVIFFSSDTGPQTGGGVDPKFFQSAGPFRGGRGDLYEGGLRVPMIVSWPGTIPAGTGQRFPVGRLGFPADGPADCAPGTTPKH